MRKLYLTFLRKKLTKGYDTPKKAKKLNEVNMELRRLGVI